MLRFRVHTTDAFLLMISNDTFKRKTRNVRYMTLFEEEQIKTSITIFIRRPNLSERLAIASNRGLFSVKFGANQCRGLESTPFRPKCKV